MSGTVHPLGTGHIAKKGRVSWHSFEYRSLRTYPLARWPSRPSAPNRHLPKPVLLNLKKVGLLAARLSFRIRRRHPRTQPTPFTERRLLPRPRGIRRPTPPTPPIRPPPKATPWLSPVSGPRSKTPSTRSA